MVYLIIYCRICIIRNLRSGRMSPEWDITTRLVSLSHVRQNYVGLVCYTVVMILAYRHVHVQYTHCHWLISDHFVSLSQILRFFLSSVTAVNCSPVAPVHSESTIFTILPNTNLCIIYWLIDWCQLWTRVTSVKSDWSCNLFCFIILLANVNSSSCSLYVIVCPSVVCLSSVVCNVRAPYSDDWNFPKCFYAIGCVGHLLTSR